MDDTHRELVNNNVLFVDEGDQREKTLKKWHDNNDDKVREITYLLLSLVLRPTKYISSYNPT